MFGAGQRTSGERSKPQLHALVELVKKFKPVLGHVAALAQFAVVEIAQDGLPLDKNTCVTCLPVAPLLQPSEAGFEPVTAAGARIARCVAGLSESCCRGIGR